MGVPAEVDTEIWTSGVEGVFSLRTHEGVTDRSNEGTKNRIDTIEESNF